MNYLSLIVQVFVRPPPANDADAVGKCPFISWQLPDWAGKSSEFA